jgi:O-antigen/teichoic acid export membrane protein
VATIIAVCSSWLASFLLQKEFYQAWTLIPIMVVAFYFNVLNSYYGTVYTATLKTKSLFTTTIWGALCCAGATWMLIPCLGVAGACMGMVLSNLLVFVLRVFSSRTILRFEVQWSLVIATAVLLTIQAMVIWLQTPYGNIVAIAIAVVICVLQVFSVAKYIDVFIGRIKHHSK